MADIDRSYYTDRLEARGVFRGFFAKNPGSTVRTPSQSVLRTAKRIGSAARKRSMSTPFEGAWTVTDKKAGGTGGRLETLDMIRGLTIISMVLYHGMWDLLYLSRFGAEMSTARTWYEGIGGHLWQQSICRSFILLAGFCVPFSKHIFRRGLLVSACGILVSAVTVFAMYEERVLFGVLTFHGAAMLLAGAGRQIKKGRSEQLCGWRTAEETAEEEFSGGPVKTAAAVESTGGLTKPAAADDPTGRPVKPAAAAESTGGLTKPAAGVLLSAFFFHVTRWVNRGYLQLGPVFHLALPAFLYKREGAGGWILTAAGFPMKGFFSTDYFSLIPWIFLFQTGICLCRLMEKGKVFSRPVFHLRAPLLNLIGQYSLLIYLLHQPLLYLLVSVFS